jgi:hypothetical protein
MRLYEKWGLQMKATTWTTWEKHLPSTNMQTKTRTFSLCLKPWDKILAEEGIDERINSPEQIWRTWEKYLSLENKYAALYPFIYSREETNEAVLV